MEEMMTVEAVAKLFNVSTRTVTRLVVDGQIQALRVGRQWRFKREWIDEWIEKNTTQADKDTA